MFVEFLKLHSVCILRFVSPNDFKDWCSCLIVWCSDIKQLSNSRLLYDMQIFPVFIILWLDNDNPDVFAGKLLASL